VLTPAVPAVRFAAADAVPAAVQSAAELRLCGFIDNLLVRIHFVVVMIRWTGLAPWEFEFPFPGSLTPRPLLQYQEYAPPQQMQYQQPQFSQPQSYA